MNATAFQKIIIRTLINQGLGDLSNQFGHLKVPLFHHSYIVLLVQIDCGFELKILI